MSACVRSRAVPLAEAALGGGRAAAVVILAAPARVANVDDFATVIWTRCCSIVDARASDGSSASRHGGLMSS
jgi:hypothetical protein